MRVNWTRPALVDVLQIRDYIAADSPRYSRIVAERVFATVDHLAEYPLAGRMVPELDDPTLREHRRRAVPNRISCSLKCSRDHNRRACGAAIPDRRAA